MLVTKKKELNSQNFICFKYIKLIVRVHQRIKVRQLIQKFIMKRIKRGAFV